MSSPRTICCCLSYLDMLCTQRSTGSPTLSQKKELHLKSELPDDLRLFFESKRGRSPDR